MTEQRSPIRIGPITLAARSFRRRSNGNRPPRSPVAFVLSSGANLGAVQVGMLKALVEHGIYPDLILGCSVGALNGASFAQDPTPARMEEIEAVWTSADGKELMPRQWLSPARALTRRGEAIHPLDGLRQLVERSITAPTFEALAIPFQCVATDVIEATEHWFDSGPLVEPILASSAMPAIFPTVEVDGRRFFDGAAVNDVPVRRAAELGARTIFAMEVGPLSRPWAEPKKPADSIMEAYWIARRYRFKRDVEDLPDRVALHLLPHGDPPILKFHDFSQSELLIRNAYVATSAYLTETYGSAPISTPPTREGHGAGPPPSYDDLDSDDELTPS
jgi:NTE family protein